MAKIDKRFQILFPEEELLSLKAEADKRGISQAELIRLALQKEITKKSDYSRLQALRNLAKLFS